MRDLRASLSTCLLATAALLGVASPAGAAVAPILGSASNFAVLSAAPGSAGAVTCTDANIIGDVGSSDAPASVTQTNCTIAGAVVAPVSSQVLADFNTAGLDDDPTVFNYGTPQLLQLLNTRLTSRPILNRDLSKLPVPEAITQLYLMALSRRPSALEMQMVQEYLNKSKAGYEGIYRALLNSAEFAAGIGAESGTRSGFPSRASRSTTGPPG